MKLSENQRHKLAIAVIQQRVRRRMSIPQLADAACVSPTTITRIERTADRGPERDTIVKICDALDIDSSPFLIPEVAEL